MIQKKILFLLARDFLVNFRDWALTLVGSQSTQADQVQEQIKARHSLALQLTNPRELPLSAEARNVFFEIQRKLHQVLSPRFEEVGQNTTSIDYATAVLAKFEGLMVAFTKLSSILFRNSPAALDPFDPMIDEKNQSGFEKNYFLLVRKHINPALKNLKAFIKPPNEKTQKLLLGLEAESSSTLSLSATQQLQNYDPIPELQNSRGFVDFFVSPTEKNTLLSTTTENFTVAKQKISVAFQALFRIIKALLFLSGAKTEILRLVRACGIGGDLLVSTAQNLVEEAAETYSLRNQGSLSFFLNKQLVLVEEALSLYNCNSEEWHTSRASSLKQIEECKKAIQEMSSAVEKLRSYVQNLERTELVEEIQELSAAHERDKPLTLAALKAIPILGDPDTDDMFQISIAKRNQNRLGLQQATSKEQRRLLLPPPEKEPRLATVPPRPELPNLNTPSPVEQLEPHKKKSTQRIFASVILLLALEGALNGMAYGIWYLVPNANMLAAFLAASFLAALITGAILYLIFSLLPKTSSEASSEAIQLPPTSPPSEVPGSSFPLPQKGLSPSPTNETTGAQLSHA